MPPDDRCVAILQDRLGVAPADNSLLMVARQACICRAQLPTVRQDNQARIVWSERRQCRCATGQLGGRCSVEKRRYAAAVNAAAGHRAVVVEI